MLRLKGEHADADEPPIDETERDLDEDQEEREDEPEWSRPPGHEGQSAKAEPAQEEEEEARTPPPRRRHHQQQDCDGIISLVSPSPPRPPAAVADLSMAGEEEVHPAAAAQVAPSDSSLSVPPESHSELDLDLFLEPCTKCAQPLATDLYINVCGHVFHGRWSATRARERSGSREHRNSTTR